MTHQSGRFIVLWSGVDSDGVVEGGVRYRDADFHLVCDARGVLRLVSVAPADDAPGLEASTLRDAPYARMRSAIWEHFEQTSSDIRGSKSSFAAAWRKNTQAQLRAAEAHTPDKAELGKLAVVAALYSRLTKDGTPKPREEFCKELGRIKFQGKSVWTENNAKWLINRLSSAGLLERPALGNRGPRSLTPKAQAILTSIGEADGQH